ncbi:MAG: cupin domain-containing protein [Wenzhouxiangella sp.]
MNDPTSRSRRLEPLNDERKASMKHRLLASVGGEMEVVRGRAARWVSLLPGVRFQLLNSDPEAGVQTALWRMDAGSHIPAHPHSKDEECFIFEGSVEIRGERYQAGDYMLAPAGSRHARIQSDEGVLMLIRGERLTLRDRLLLRTAVYLGY